MRVNKVGQFSMNEDLRALLQEYVDRGGFDSVSEALRALVIRGLYLDEQPRGRWSESAWIAAYHSFRGIMFDTFHRRVLGRDFKQLVDVALDEVRERLSMNLDESFEAAFSEALRRSGANVL